MKRSILSAASVATAFFLAGLTSAHSAELKVLCANAMQPVLEDLKSKFELEAGHKLTLVYEPLGIALKRLEAGETADVVILPREGIDRLMNREPGARNTVADLARSVMGVAVHKGAPKPDISSVESFKRTMLGAKSVNVADPGRSAGTQQILGIFQRLGISDQMKPKLVYTTGLAAVAAGVANGEVEIALYHLQELALVAGIEIVGPFPREVEATIVFSAMIMRSARDVEVARTFISFLRTPEAAAVIRTRGMESAAP